MPEYMSVIDLDTDECSVECLACGWENEEPVEHHKCRAEDVTFPNGTLAEREDDLDSSDEIDFSNWVDDWSEAWREESDVDLGGPTKEEIEEMFDELRDE